MFRNIPKYSGLFQSVQEYSKIFLENSIMEQSLQNVPSDNADYEDIWINVPYIETDSDTL